MNEFKTPRSRRIVGFHATLVATALMLSACGQETPEPPAPLTVPLPITTPPPTAGGDDASVPDAASVVTPAETRHDEPTDRRAREPLTDTQESQAMPLPGQNNDHSLPPTAGQPASAP